MQCNYCEKNAALSAIMETVCELPASTVYLMRDQSHKGRCVVALNQHKEEICELTDEERNAFFDDVNRVSAALLKLYAPGKINLAVYGDTVRHFHVHVVPKYPDMADFGGAFSPDIEPVILNDDAFEKRICEIRTCIMGRNNK